MKISFFTLGCRLNQSETAVLEGVFREKGFGVVPFASPADVAVINSCTVTAAGDSDARRAVNKAVRLNPAVRVAVIGCQAQVQKKALLKWPGVRWVVGTARKMALAEVILEDIAADAARLLVGPVSRKTFCQPLSTGKVPGGDGSRTRAAIKIQDGCDNFCAYCEIPYARGRSRSRQFADLCAEAGALAAAGYKEVVITGVNVGDYADGGKTLLDVVAAIEKVRGIARVRVSSIEHTRLPLEMIKFMRLPHKLCRFLHIPVQSGCDRILKRMGRRYTCAQMEALLMRLVKEVPGIMLGTDVIVGFPGETAADFEATRDFLARMPLGYFHVFSYSDRHRARSRAFKGTVPPAEIARRSQVLRALGEAKREAFLKGLLGTRQTVLFEQKKNDYWIGHTDNYVTIKMASSDDMKNQLATVIIESAGKDCLFSRRVIS